MTAPIVVSGRTWGVIVAAFKHPDAVRPDTEARMAQFTELVATAIANAQSGAELTASTAPDRRDGGRDAPADRARPARRRAAAAGAHDPHPEARPERAGHDDGPTAELVGEGLAHAERAIAEIRELAHGIHPAVLTDRGLVKALRALVQRSTVPVMLETHIDRRLPEPVEVTVYYVVSEALTNVAKHAQATRVQVTLEERGGELRLCISDDGVGGADPSRGSGLVGLKDRVEAGGGTLTVESQPDAGTRLDIAIPLRAAEPAVRG